jgi:hypothetical protein
VPLGQVDQEHLGLVHDSADVQVLFGRGQNPIEQGISEECPDLVLDRRRAIGAVHAFGLVRIIEG